MDSFKVWSSRSDGATCLRVDGLENANWLIRRLSGFFVFKTSEPVREVPDSSDCAFRVAHNSRLSGQQFDRLLAGIAEVNLVVEPPQPLRRDVSKVRGN
jgi:hypothetical protein